MTPTFRPAALKTARTAAGLTQQQAAVRAGVTAGTVKNIESGRHEPKVELAARLASIYGVAIDQFFVHETEGATSSDVHGKPHEPGTAAVGGSAGLAHEGA